MTYVTSFRCSANPFKDWWAETMREAMTQSSLVRTMYRCTILTRTLNPHYLSNLLTCDRQSRYALPDFVPQHLPFLAPISKTRRPLRDNASRSLFSSCINYIFFSSDVGDFLSLLCLYPS